MHWSLMIRLKNSLTWKVLMPKPLVRDFLKQARTKLAPDSQVADYIVADLLQISLAQLPAYYSQPFEQFEIAQKWVKQFLAGVPYQYLSHQAYFYDLAFYVDQRVLIPRPETEELVAWILQLEADRPLRVLDLATGSGAIGITLKKHRPHWQVVASDVSKGALTVAQKNAQKNQVKIALVLSNLFQEITGKFDLVVSNPPYIASSEITEMDQRVLDYEPPLALFAPQEGLYFYQKIYQQITHYLMPKGSLFMEFGFKQKLGLQQIFTQGRLTFKKDLAGKDRMLWWQND